MFNGAHVIIYSQQAEADRAFLRDHLGLANVDAGDGWLIFKLPPAELAIHPTDGQTKTRVLLHVRRRRGGPSEAHGGGGRHLHAGQR